MFTRSIGFALLAALFVSYGGPARADPPRRELFNRSSQGWRLILVEGTEASAGRLDVIDKFSGNRIGTLAKVGDSLPLPAGARYLVAYTSDHQAFFQDLLVRDSHGAYAEYLARIPFRADPCPELSFKDKQVGPPLDEATDEAVLRCIEEAISTDDGNLIILRDFLAPEGTQPDRR